MMIRIKNNKPEHQTPEKTESESQKTYIIPEDTVSLTRVENVIYFK